MYVITELHQNKLIFEMVSPTLPSIDIKNVFKILMQCSQFFNKYAYEYYIGV